MRFLCHHLHHTAAAALGTRVKYLLDTPEAIWGSLEAGQHIEAARRQLRAEQVHAALHAAHGRDVSARFPLLTHQWPFVVAARCGRHYYWWRLD
jgi:conserved oligomeric Golgi complex subunit 1